MIHVIQLVINGFVDGSILALAALGITLVFVASRFANVAHGDLMTLGAYLALLSSKVFGWNMILSSLFAIGGTILVGLIVYHTVFKPLSIHSNAVLLISSIGVALVLRYSIYLIWGSSLQSYPIPLSRSLRFDGLQITKLDLTVSAVALAAMALLYVLLNYTRTGTEMRAVANVPDLARVSGISSARTLNITWSVALALAAIGGVLLATESTLIPTLGWDILLSAFAAAILGGFGNPAGAVLGGYVLGISESLSTLFIDPKYKLIIGFVVLAVVIIIKPNGILGGSK